MLRAVDAYARGARPRVPDRRRHPRRRGGVGRARQDRGQGRRGRQADLSRAVRPRRIAAAAPPTCVDARARRARGAPGSADSCRPSRAGSSAARIEERHPSRRAARGARARRLARTRARADPGRPACASTASRSPRPARRSRADAEITVATPDHPYVGRGGLKLAHALDAFGIDRHGTPRARHRRVDRRLHRRAAAARRARASSRSTSATASSIGSCAAIRGSSCSSASTPAR